MRMVDLTNIVAGTSMIMTTRRYTVTDMVDLTNDFAETSIGLPLPLLLVY